MGLSPRTSMSILAVAARLSPPNHPPEAMLRLAMNLDTVGSSAERDGHGTDGGRTMVVGRCGRLRSSRTRLAPWALLATASVSGCGEAELTADSSCREYLDRARAERTDAAVRISSQVEAVPNPGNPLWANSLDASCGSAPSRTLRQAFGGGRVLGEAGEAGLPSGGKDNEPAESLPVPPRWPLSHREERKMQHWPLPKMRRPQYKQSTSMMVGSSLTRHQKACRRFDQCAKRCEMPLAQRASTSYQSSAPEETEEDRAFVNWSYARRWPTGEGSGLSLHENSHEAPD